MSVLTHTDDYVERRPSPFHRLWASIERSQTERARPRVAQYLRALDDTTLAGLGLTRADIETMARRRS